jgi:hypothetical protein
MEPSPSLPNSDDPGATLARACLNAGDFNAAERSGAARSCLFPRSDPSPFDLDRTARTTRYRFAQARLAPWPACQRHPQPLIRPGLTFPRPMLIEWFGPLGPPRTPVAVRFPSSAGPARSARSLPLCR